jgi:PQQ-dependent dehydrogenase (methanol/ethanol family)
MRVLGKILGVAALSCALLLAACGEGGKPVDGKRIAAGASGEWLNYGRTYDEQRHSPLTKINADTVSGLGLAWFAAFDTDRAQQATPLVFDGVLYTTTAWSKVFAFDATTGAPLWSYDPKVPGETAVKACCDVGNRGVAAWKGKIFVGALDGRLIALDAKTGAEQWSVVTVDQSKPYTITGAPRVIDGKVMIGNGGAELGVRGYLSAYDADTGKLVWRFYTTPNPDGKPDGAASDPVLAEKAASTWSDGAWKRSGGGGTVWDAMAYDPALGTLYFGVGNGAPWNHQIRSGGKGDNLFLSSIVAVDAKTGAYKWHYQTTPGDSWDYTATQHIMLADLTIEGRPRKVLMQAPKNGFFYVLDRETGALISAKPYIPMGPADPKAPPGTPFSWSTGQVDAQGRPIENPGARYEKGPAVIFPAPYGGHNWHPMAFNPKDGLVYIPVLAPNGALAQLFVSDAKFTYRDGAWNTGSDWALASLPDDEAFRRGLRAMLTGQLLAWDPVKQEARWKVDLPSFWNGGVLATAGGLVFQGTAEGKFAAYNAADGKEVWSYDAVNGIIAAPMTYEVKGEQYVAVMVGYGGAAALAASTFLSDRPRLPGRLLVFKLGGTATAPAYDIPPKPPLDLTNVSSRANPRRGEVIYNENCLVCHGPNATGAYLPDLRRSQIVRDAGSFRSVVIDGALSANGMVSFKDRVSAQDAETVRAYIIEQARRLQRVEAADAAAAKKK